MVKCFVNILEFRVGIVAVLVDRSVLLRPIYSKGRSALFRSEVGKWSKMELYFLLGFFLCSCPIVRKALPYPNPLGNSKKITVNKKLYGIPRNSFFQLFCNEITTETQGKIRKQFKHAIPNCYPRVCLVKFLLYPALYLSIMGLF